MKLRDKRVVKQGSPDLTLQTARVTSYRKRLAQDHDPRYFDDQLRDFASEYAFEGRNLVSKVNRYLDTVTDNDGVKFSASCKQYAKMKENLDRFKMPNHPNFHWNENYQAAKAELSQQFKGRLEQINFNSDESIIDALPKLSTHAGFVSLETGNTKKGDNLDDVYAKLESFIGKSKQDGKFRRSMMVGCRTQVSGAFKDDGTETNTCKHKSRVVLMVDLYQILVELGFSKPVQKAMAGWQSYAGGKDDRAIHDIIQSNMSTKYCWQSIDYSHFDQSISDWLIRDAFDIIKVWFNQDKIDVQLYDLMVDAFINKTIMDADGDFDANKGVPSGSMFTQIIDTIVNLLMVRTFIYAKGFQKELINMIAMGDDNLIMIPKLLNQFTMEELTNYLAYNFGVEANAEKSSYGLCGKQDPEFLSRFWTIGGPERNVKIIIQKMLFPERYRDYHNAETKIHEVFYSYFMAYESTMRKYFDMNRFFRDYPQLMDLGQSRRYEIASRQGSGYWYYNMSYIMKPSH